MRQNTQTVARLGLAAFVALSCACSGDESGSTGSSSGGSSLLAENGIAVPASLPASFPSTNVDLPASLPVGPVDPATAKVSWTEGVAAFENGSYGEATEKLAVAVAGRPQDAYASFLLGLAQWRSGNVEDAERSFESSLTVDATRPKTWINLARVRMERTDAKGALEASTKALDIDPGSADALHQEGRALLALGRGAEAEASLLAARGIDPDNGYLANTLGLLLIQAGRPTEATPHLEAAKERLPHVSYVRNNLGVAYERTGRREEALVEYQAAVDAGDVGHGLASLSRLGPLVAKDLPAPTGTE